MNTTTHLRRLDHLLALSNPTALELAELEELLQSTEHAHAVEQWATQWAQRTPTRSKTFTSTLVRQGSWGALTITGQYESTMDLYLHQGGDTGHIEWDIPSLEETGSIGLWFDLSPEGVRTMTDYDGVMALPVQAVQLLREAGVVVTNDFDDAARFAVDGFLPCSYHDFVISHCDDHAVCEWALTAQVGDMFPALPGCTRVA